MGRGVRTRIADDLLWLPYVVSTVSRDHRRWRRPRRDRPLPRGADARRRPGRVVLRAARVRAAGHALRALRPRARPEPRRREPRSPPDGHGRLERRHEPGRRRGQGRERLARVVPSPILREWATAGRRARGAASAPRRGAATSALLEESLDSEAWDGDWYRRAYFDDGTPLGSAVNDACRIDSIAQSWGVISGAAEPARARRAMASVEEHLVRRRDGLVLAPRAAIRPHAPRARLHQGLPAGRAGKWRPVHACGDLGGHRLRGARRRRQGGRAVLDPESDPSHEHASRESSATRSSPTSSRGTCTRSLRTSVAAAGPGTRARRGGCIGPGSSRSSASGCAAPISSSTLASRESGRASPSRSATTPRGTTSSSRTRSSVTRGVSSVEVDGVPLGDHGGHPARGRSEDPSGPDRARLRRADPTGASVTHSLARLRGSTWRYFMGPVWYVPCNFCRYLETGPEQSRNTAMIHRQEVLARVEWPAHPWPQPRDEASSSVTTARSSSSCAGGSMSISGPPAGGNATAGRCT